MNYLKASAAPLLVFLLIDVTSNTAQAQNLKPPDDRTLQMLVNEVRLLRESIQRMNLNAYRGQIIVERIRAQNDRVTRLTRMLDDTREEIAGVQVRISQLTERAKAIENQIQQEWDSKQRPQLEVEQREYKYLLDMERQRLERLRERESRLNAESQTEQGKLNDLDGRLDALEREIGNEIERQHSTSQKKSDRP